LIYFLQNLQSLFAWWLNECLGGFDFLFFILQPLANNIKKKGNKENDGKDGQAADFGGFVRDAQGDRNDQDASDHYAQTDEIVFGDKLEKRVGHKFFLYPNYRLKERCWQFGRELVFYFQV
jgi:hypothetical protein